jgi:hypothetical protein
VSDDQDTSASPFQGRPHHDVRPSKAVKSDPRNELSLYDSAAVPSVADGVAEIYDYVQERAQALGLHIKKNRGLPPKARIENMLTVEEKALYILGRATGVTYKEILRRIEALRTEEGRAMGDTTSFFKAGERVVAAHKPVIQAIQTDMLNAAEAFSPLVGGPQRFAWRARLLEWYREKMLEAEIDPSLEDAERVERIQSLDRSMQTHLSWFDRLAGSKNVLGALSNISDRAAAQTLKEAEAAVERSFRDGDITDTERIERLRHLRHGE